MVVVDVLGSVYAKLRASAIAVVAVFVVGLPVAIVALLAWNKRCALPPRLLRCRLVLRRLRLLSVRT